VNTVLLGTLLLLLSALLLLFDLVLAHFVGFKLKTGGERELGGLNGVVCDKRNPPRNNFLKF
jgi:hypothetical protein